MAVYQNVLSGEKRQVDGDDVFWYEDNRANWARLKPVTDRFAPDPALTLEKKTAKDEKPKDK